MAKEGLYVMQRAGCSAGPVGAGGLKGLYVCVYVSMLEVCVTEQ